MKWWHAVVLVSIPLEGFIALQVSADEFKPRGDEVSIPLEGFIALQPVRAS